jgi:hypothetical protein
MQIVLCIFFIFASSQIFNMKVILDIEESRVPFFMELVKSLEYINIVKEVRDKRKQEIIKDLAEAFNDVRLHEAGKKKLKTAKQLLNEL